MKTNERKTMNNTNTNETPAAAVVVANVTTSPANVKTTKPTPKTAPAVKGKVGAPTKAIKLPRGAFTVKQLFAFQGVNEAGKPNICELTVRNYVTARTQGYRMVKRQVNGKTSEVKVEVPVTLVQLPENETKKSPGRPNYRYISKAVYDANRNRKPATKPAVTNKPTPTAAPVVA